MTAIALSAHTVVKPWGRHSLFAGFDDIDRNDPPVGEIWFDPDSPAAPLMVKYLFTSERLSVQVHPDDAAARAAGHARGKDEVWVILAADRDATIALGPRRLTTREALAAAARDGSIVDLLDWRPVTAGEVIYAPAGTIHALGAGLTLIEIQQNVDLTYRLYDYGRPRALHLDAGLEVAITEPFIMAGPPDRPGTVGRVIAAGRAFSVERLGVGSYDIDLGETGSVFTMISGSGMIDGQPVGPGRCWSVADQVTLELDDDADALLSFPTGVAPTLGDRKHRASRSMAPA